MGAVYYPSLEGSRIANATRTWQANEDVGKTDWDKAVDFILATAIATSKGPLTYAYKLQWRNKTDGGSFADVSDAGEITYSAVTDLVDGDGVTSGEEGCTGAGTLQDGLESEGDNLLPDSGTYELLDEYWAELHWALDCSNALDGKEYEFQLLTAGDNIIGVCLATLTIATEAQTFYQTLEATTTPSASLVKATSKLTGLGATTTPLASLLKSISPVAMAASSTPSAGLATACLLSQSLGATSTPLAGLSEIPTFTEILAATTTPVIALNKKISKTLAATTTPAGSLLKKTAKTLVATTTPVASLTKKMAVILAATTTPLAGLTTSFAEAVSAGLKKIWGLLR